MRSVANVPQPRMRSALTMPAASASEPVTVVLSVATSAMARAAMLSSARTLAFGHGLTFACGSAFLVKDGITRPPSTPIISRMRSMAMRSPRDGSQSMAPIEPRWMARLMSPSTMRTIGNTTFRRLPVARRGIASTIANAGRNATSTPIASHTGTPGTIRATRPAIHNPASAASPAPVAVRRPVQLVAAVSRKPAITATAKPNTISWPCQMVGGREETGSSAPW